MENVHLSTGKTVNIFDDFLWFLHWKILFFLFPYILLVVNIFKALPDFEAFLNIFCPIFGASRPIHPQKSKKLHSDETLKLKIDFFGFLLLLPESSGKTNPELRVMKFVTYSGFIYLVSGVLFPSLRCATKRARPNSLWTYRSCVRWRGSAIPDRLRRTG